MGGITARGLPYPTGTDLVMEGDDAIKALAEAVDQRTPSIYWSNVSLAGAANAVRSETATYPVGMFLTAPAVVLQILTGTTNADGTNTETWVNNRTTASCTVNVNRNNTTTITVSFFAMERTGPYAAAQVLAGELAPLAKGVGEAIIDATVTCPTSGCWNEGHAIPVSSTYESDPDAGTREPVDRFVCGVCGTDITNTLTMN
jgi:hypothetical protein